MKNLNILTRLGFFWQRRVHAINYTLRNPLRVLSSMFDPLSLYSKYFFYSPRYLTDYENYDVRSGLERCKVAYINLSHRTDRNVSILDEFASVGIKDATRINAVQRRNGAEGCSASHFYALQSFRNSNSDLFMVCEDDCSFIVDADALSKVIEEFFRNPKLDVLCLAFRVTNFRKKIKISNSLKITNSSRTTACYVLKPHMIDPLMDVAKRSETSLAAGGNAQIFALDVLWKELQSKYIFCVPSTRTAKQISSYSDIEQKNVSYRV